MTKQSPRIYVYKITFLEVPHYYYGAHLEKVFNEYYMGSPETHKNFWKLYTPQKELIKEFPYTDEGWLEALDFEDSLIEPVYNIDPLCLNEHCGGKVSLDVCRKTGRRNYELGLGIHAQTKKERIENGKRGYENGLANFSKEERIENGKKSGQRCYELGVGIHALTKEERIENGKKTSSQVWECTVTGYRSTPAGLSSYQKARGIDTKNRRRIK